LNIAQIVNQDQEARDVIDGGVMSEVRNGSGLRCKSGQKARIDGVVAKCAVNEKSSKN
jgi:hypothetical protein